MLGTIKIIIPFFGLLSILAAFYLYRWVSRQENKNLKMKEFSEEIQKGASDTKKCVDIATKGALKELIVPGTLAFLAPLSVGFILGPAALGGFLAGSIVVGIIFASLITRFSLFKL